MMQNIQVVAIERDTAAADRRRGATRPRTRRQKRRQAEADEARSRGERTVSTITLLVQPEQAQQLVLAQELGTLTLTLRSNLDAGQVIDLGSLDQLGLLRCQCRSSRRRDRRGVSSAGTASEVRLTV